MIIIFGAGLVDHRHPQRQTHDIALGNVLGSNLFITQAVVGIAGMIHPMTARPEVFSRGIVVMDALTISLFAIGYRPRGSRINRFEGVALLICYVVHTFYIFRGVCGS